RPHSTVAIEATDPVAHESGDSAEFTITRHGGLTTSDQTVTYTIDGTAEPGLDYEDLSGTAVIAAGETSTAVTITPFLESNVSGDEGTEQIRLTLDDSTDYALAENSTATAALMDNEFLTIGDQSISRNGVLTVDLPATNPAGAAIGYEVLIGGDLLFTLNRQCNLTSTGNFYTDHTGAMEKCICGTSGSGAQEWFFILPNGDFGQATGVFDNGLVANVGTDAYHDPRLLLEAPAPASDQIDNGVLTITPATGFAGVFEVTLNQGIGDITSSTTFQVTVTNSAPVLDPIADQSHSVSAGPITIPLLATHADNDSLTFSVTFSGPGGQAAQLNE
ncbi:MAG: Calx-beta domain-containing protein, partial [Planctomycetaceae bacterium]